jgi:hypothetical protein
MRRTAYAVLVTAVLQVTELAGQVSAPLTEEGPVSGGAEDLFAAPDLLLLAPLKPSSRIARTKPRTDRPR